MKDFKTIEKALAWLEEASIEAHAKDKFAVFNWDFHFSNHPGATEPITYLFIIRTERTYYVGSGNTPLKSINESIEKYLKK